MNDEEADPIFDDFFEIITPYKNLSDMLNIVILTFLLVVIAIAHSNADGSPHNGNNYNSHSPLDYERNNHYHVDNRHHDVYPSLSDPQKTQNNASNLVIEIWEHEFYNITRNSWVGGSGRNTQRWTSSKNADHLSKALPPPPQLMPPKGYNYTCEWKIDVTGSSSIKDELGWEYFIDRNERRRRRRWLRNVALNTVVDTSNDQENNSNSFEFKGFGLSLYKSMLNRNYGVVLRLPITSHLHFFEKRPWLPLVTSTCALDLPLRGDFSINASLPMAFINCFLLTLYDQVKYGCTLVWFIISKTIVVDIIQLFLLSGIGRMLGFGNKYKRDIIYNHDGEAISVDNNGKMKNIFRRYPSLPQIRHPTYCQEISERIGVSLVWRCTDMGSEVKCSWWHCFIPTISYIGDNVIKRHANSISHPNIRKSIKYLACNQWIRQKAGSVGIILGGFNRHAPFISCSSALSFSGLYCNKKKINNVSVTSTNQQETTTRPKSKKFETGSKFSDEAEEILDEKLRVC